MVAGECCPTILVTGMEGLDDTYTFSEDRGSKPEPVCEDGCVYTRVSSPEDEYCFKAEETGGLAQCQDVGTTPSLQTLEGQKDGLESEVADLEAEVADLDADEDAANTLDTELDKVDDKIEELTSDGTTPSGRVRRQAPDAPETCDEIADIIEQIADPEKTNAERLSLVQQILATKITKCKSKDKLTKTKVKIKVVKTETGERIKIILKKKTKKNAEIQEKKKLIIKLTIQIEEIKGTKPPTGEVEVTMKPGGMTNNPTGEQPIDFNPTGKPTGEQPVGIDFTGKPTGEKPVGIDFTGKPTGEQPVGIDFTGKPTGQQPIEIDFTGKPTGQQPIEIDYTGKPTGQQPIEVNFTGKPTGQQAVEINVTGLPTGQQAVEINSTGQQEVEITTAAA